MCGTRQDANNNKLVLSNNNHNQYNTNSLNSKLQQTQPIVSLKKSSSNALNTDKYQPYLQQQHQDQLQSRQILTTNNNIGYSTQQILPLSQYTAASVHQNILNIGTINTIMPKQQYSRTDQYRVTTNKSKGGSPGGSSNKKGLKSIKPSSKQRKSVSKENQSITSSRGASQFIQDIHKPSHYNVSGKTVNKHKSRVVKSSIKNQNSTLNEQIAALYNQNLSDLNNKSPQSQQQLSLEHIGQRCEIFEDQLKQRVSNLQQNYQSLPNNSKTQRINGKAIMRNNSQMKIKTLNNQQSQNVDSFDAVNSNLLSGYALTTKNQLQNSNHIFSISQSNLRSNPKDSFQMSQSNLHRNGKSHIQDQYQNEYNASNNIDNSNSTNTVSITRPSNQNKIQQKIQKIIQATQQSTTINSLSQQSASHLQNSYSQGNLRKSLQHHNNSVNNSNSIPKIFRPQSLKQLMPTIDEQIMKLTESNTGSPLNLFQDVQRQNQQQNSLFKCLADQASRIQSTQNKGSHYKLATQFSSINQQPPSQFKGQIIKTINNNNHHNRNLPLQFNHKESIEGGKLSQEQREHLRIQTPSNERISPVKATIESCQQTQTLVINNIDENMQQQLKEILMRTQLTLKASKKKENELQNKCNEQEKEIQYLKDKLLKYEQIIPTDQQIID